jgi:hypothetical protein
MVDERDLVRAGARVEAGEPEVMPRPRGRRRVQLGGRGRGRRRVGARAGVKEGW